MADETVQVKECISCGGSANANSPRGFCTQCDKEFAAGIENQKRVEARAEALELAKEQGDKAKVAEIMTDIFGDVVQSPPVTSEPVSFATASKVEEK